jgi:hypothetical protein
MKELGRTTIEMVSVASQMQHVPTVEAGKMAKRPA